MRIIRTEFVTLFLLAGCVALLAVPLKVISWLPGDHSFLLAVPIPERPFWHGHAMLVGYAQMVLGGYLLTRPGQRTIMLYGTLWLMARAAIFVPGTTGLILGAAFNIAVFAMLFIYAGLNFFRAAKRLKSAIPGMIIFLLLLAESLYQAGAIYGYEMLCEGALRGVIWLMILLLFMMGGRIIAAATSGALQKRDLYRPYMAQGRLETVGIATLIAAATTDLAMFPVAISAFFSILAAAIIFCRLWNWRVWLVWDFFDLTSLHLGYAMLAGGMVFYAVQTLIFGASSLVDFHGVLIGGFALLSITVMCRTIMQRLRFTISLPISMRLASLCLIASALSRIAAFQDTASRELLIISGILWECAFIGFIGTLIWLVCRFRSAKIANANRS